LVLFATEAALVHESMMMATQQHEIIETRLSAITPVPDVVSVDEMPVGSARETASFVSCL
jgi:hypothetical protein